MLFKTIFEAAGSSAFSRLFKYLDGIDIDGVFSSSHNNAPGPDFVEKIRENTNFHNVMICKNYSMSREVIRTTPHSPIADLSHSTMPAFHL